MHIFSKFSLWHNGTQGACLRQGSPSFVSFFTLNNWTKPCSPSGEPKRYSLHTMHKCIMCLNKVKWLNILKGNVCINNTIILFTSCSFTQCEPSLCLPLVCLTCWSTRIRRVGSPSGVLCHSNTGAAGGGPRSPCAHKALRSDARNRLRSPVAPARTAILRVRVWDLLILARGGGLRWVWRRPVGLVRSLDVAEPAADLLVPGEWPFCRSYSS